MRMKDTVTIRRTPHGYTVTFAGPSEAEMRRLFGTTTLPTPYGPGAHPAAVLETIRRQNPGARVLFAREVLERQD